MVDLKDGFNWNGAESDLSRRWHHKAFGVLRYHVEIFCSVKNFSQSTSCRYPIFLDSCKDEFGITYAKETKYRKCRPLDNKRYRVCTETSVVLPKRETLKKKTKCDFPKFLEICDEAFGSGWRQYGRSRCGAKKRRRKCRYQTVDQSSSFFVARTWYPRVSFLFRFASIENVRGSKWKEIKFH